jgi:hypothetical protein
MGCRISDRSEVFQKNRLAFQPAEVRAELGSVPFAGPVKNSQENYARGVIDERVPGFFMSYDEE